MIEVREQMEAITDSVRCKQKRELIRLSCRKKKELWVTRSFLTKSSSYFAAMLSEGSVWEESSNRVIELSSWSRNDLLTIMNCLRTKEPEIIFKDVNRYFEAINYFSISPLVEQCIEYKIANVCDETVLDDLKLSEQYSIGALSDKCMEHLLSNLRRILEHPHSSRRMPKELLKKLLRHSDLPRTLRKEDEVLSMIDLWHSSSKRGPEDRVELLHFVRFAHLTEDAFNRCRQDAQCLQVPEFRALLESTFWSDLDESVLSGRSFGRVHFHTLGLLKWSSSDSGERSSPAVIGDSCEVVLYCSESGIKSSARGIFSEAYVGALLQRWRSVLFGGELFCCSKAPDELDVPSGSVIPFDVLLRFPDPQESSQPSTSRFPEVIYPTAPPVVVDGDLCVAHLVFNGGPVRSGGFNELNSEHFDEIEIFRYNNDRSSSKRLKLREESAQWRKICRALLCPESNKLCVENEWTMLLVPDRGLLLAIGRQPAAGSMIEIPSEHWKVESELRGKVDSFSDMVIVGDVAFVLLKFTLCKYFPIHERRRRPSFYGIEAVGNITAYDLIRGEAIPGRSLDLSSMFAAEKRAQGERYELFLKVVNKEVFLIGISNLVESRGSEFPVGRNFVYRIEMSAQKLSLTSVGDDHHARGRESRTDESVCDPRWQGMPMSVDSQPCKHATMLQLKAHQEPNPVRRQRLRHFIW